MPSSVRVYQPAPAVTIGGHTPVGLTQLLVSVVVEETVAGLMRCEVRVGNWGVRDGKVGYLWADRRTIDFGADVTVRFGPPDEQAIVFTGKVSGLEGDYPGSVGPSLVILAEDRLQDLRLARRTRTFADSTDADAINQVADDHGLSAQVDLDGPTHRLLAQVNQSDLAFVRERARPLGADVWLDGTTLHVARRADSTPIVLRYGRELLSFRVLADLAQQCTEQRVAGWDVAGKEAVLESADQSAIGAELGNDVAAGTLLGDALGERVLTSVLSSAPTSSEARALARGLYVDRARRFVTGTGVSDGIPSLRVGRSVELMGLGALFNGTYGLVRVVHRYDHDNGYRTDVDVERPGVAR
jgi:phage protein D